MNSNWVKWITASINRHFAELAISVHSEMEQNDYFNDNEFAEVRLEGPTFIELNGYTEGHITVNILLNCRMSDSNIYNIATQVGLVVAKFVNIPVYNASDTVIGCLILQSSVEVNYFGQVRTDVKKEQASVEGAYKIQLE